MNNRSYHIVILLFLLLSGCSYKKERLNVDVSKIQAGDIKIHRYDLDLFKVQPDNLKQGLQAIQHEYYFFLGTNLNDPAKLDQMRNYLQSPRNVEFQREAAARYKNMTATEIELTSLFRHYKYYFHDVKIPRVYTYISGGDYENQVRLADSVMIIAIDTYLGKDFKPYLADGIPIYKAERMTSDNIVPDAARELVNSVFSPDPSLMTLLDHMIEAGKRLYLLKALIPDTPENLLLGYSRQKYDWIKKNESHIWAAVIENRMLFSGSQELMQTFFADGPCTPDFSAESPPRLGEWVGFRIVEDYMRNNPDVSINELIKEKDTQRMLSLSGYKPEK